VAPEHIALMASDFEGGGVERTFANLASGLASLGIRTDLIAGDPHHPFLRQIDRTVRLVPALGDREEVLRGYLATERPDLLLTGKLADDFAAVAVKHAMGLGTRLVAAVGTVLSRRFAAHPLNPLRIFLETRRIRACYARLDGITAVSESVAADLRGRFRVREVPLRVLPNPVVPDDLTVRATAPCNHPWLVPGRPPVIAAVGGLRKVKDFATLIRAFALVPPEADCRLLILGEGKERPDLERLCARLGVGDRVDLHGFVEDPFPFLARSRMLALTSRREGLGNVLVEAMALGTPVVATDCEGGVRDLLQDGRLGRLVPVGDARALADAMLATLHAPIDAAVLARAAAPFKLTRAAGAHLEFFRELWTSG